MDIVVNSVLALAGFAFIVYPFLSRRERLPCQHSPIEDERKQIQIEKEAVYAAIKDLDFEYKTGKLSDEDYAELREQYRAKALTMLQQVSEPHEVVEPAIPRCRHCRHANPHGSNFCGSCGAAQQSELICASCQVAAQPGDRFCRVCGGVL